MTRTITFSNNEAVTIEATQDFITYYGDKSDEYVEDDLIFYFMHYRRADMSILESADGRAAFVNELTATLKEDQEFLKGVLNIKYLESYGL